MPEFPEDLENDAALYAIGALDAQAVAQFEDLLAKNGVAAAALKRYSLSAELLAESLEPVVPPARLKDRLFQTILSESAKKPVKPDEVGIGAIRSHEGKWKPTGIPGVTSKKLHVDKAAGLVTVLVRMEPGAVYPAHRHSRTEQCLVIEGDVSHHGHTYGPGDFSWADGGTVHSTLHTQNGNVLLLIMGTEKEERL